MIIADTAHNIPHFTLSLSTGFYLNLLINLNPGLEK
jgi:hypothetical protein